MPSWGWVPSVWRPLCCFAVLPLAARGLPRTPTGACQTTISPIGCTENRATNGRHELLYLLNLRQVHSATCLTEWFTIRTAKISWFLISSICLWKNIVNHVQLQMNQFCTIFLIFKKIYKNSESFWPRWHKFYFAIRYPISILFV